MSHLFFSLSLSLLSRFEDEEREKERENRLSLKRLDLNFFLSLFCTARSLTIFLFSRERKKERVFFLRFNNALTQPVPSQGTPAAFV